jgi:signal transduction histidine kinase/DNA-binding response OmpR family regulator
MKSIRGLSIRNKLIGIIAVATLIPLAAGFTVVIVNDARALRRELVDNTVLIARVTAENSVSDIAFNDHDASLHTLEKLASIPNLRWATVYDAHGHEFSRFAVRGAKADAALPTDSIRLFHGNELRISEPIVYQGERYGSVYLAVGTAALEAKSREHLMTLLAVLIAVIVAAIFLATRLEKIVSGPILELAALALEVSEQHDYSVRAKRKSDDETGVLAEGFNEMLTQIERRQRERDEADQRTREKSQFLANMSHELRTPLNAIIGFSEVLRTRLGSRIDDREVRFLDNINSSGQHLLGIVNDILDLSKIEAGRMEINPERFTLRNAIEGVCSLMRGVSSRRNIALELDVEDELPLLEADPVKIKQVLYNLLSNAVKFSPDRSIVTIRAARDGDLVRISVIDRGIGIDPRDHARIFQEFQQVDTTTSRQFEGTGLGLTLVRKFVEMHAGNVTVDSEVGRGATFTVTLPLRFRGIGLARDVSATGPAGVGARGIVLVIEDDDAAYRAIEQRLRESNYVPQHARSGEEGIALARELQPVAITLDLVLPGIDGIEVLKTLKAEEKTRAIPVIIVSVMDNRELGMAFGANDYFVKPVDGERVVDALRRLAPPPDSDRGKLLVIDDDREMHTMLTDRLRPYGYELLHAYGATEGFVRASSELPSLVILDLMMQEMNGFDVAARLKGDPRTSGLPILVVTKDELSGGDRVRLKGKINALIERGELSGSRLVTVIQELVNEQQVVR